MSKVYINPNGIAVMVEAAKTSQELETLLELIKTSAHPYQIGWIKEKIHTLKQQEKIIELQNQINKEALDPWEEYLKGDFNGAIKIQQEPKK